MSTSSKEVHSRDGLSYIDRDARAGWGVWWKGDRVRSGPWPIVWGTRELARVHIRNLKELEKASS